MELETEIALLKSDVNRMTSLFEKLDTAIERMGEVSNSIARMLAVHEEKLSKQEKIDEELFNLVEKRKSELEVDVKELHSRITSTQRELSNDIADTEKKIMNALTAGISDVKKCITDEHAAIEEDNKEIKKRISELEKWRWIVLGGSLVLSILSKDAIAYLFK